MKDVERGRRESLGYVVEGPRSEGIEGFFRILLSGGAHHEDGARALSHDAAQSLQPVEPGHFDIERDDIGIEGGNLGERIGSAAGGSGNFEAGLGSDHLRESGAHEGAIVDNEDANRPASCGVLGHFR